MGRQLPGNRLLGKEGDTGGFSVNDHILLARIRDFLIRIRKDTLPELTGWLAEFQVISLLFTRGDESPDDVMTPFLGHNYRFDLIHDELRDHVETTRGHLIWKIHHGLLPAIQVPHVRRALRRCRRTAILSPLLPDLRFEPHPLVLDELGDFPKCVTSLRPPRIL
jgi:hypothetical protein